MPSTRERQRRSGTQPNLPWRNSTTHEIRLLDTERNLVTTDRATNVAIGAMEVRLQAPAVALITLRAAQMPVGRDSVEP